MSEWNYDALGSIASIRRGISYSEATLEENLEDGMPYLNMKSFLKDGGYNKNGLKFFSGHFTKADTTTANDLLIANTDVTPGGDIIGVPALLPHALASEAVLFSHHVTRLHLNGQIDTRFFFYLLCTDNYRRSMRKYARGTTVLMLDMAGIKRIPVRYPKNWNIQQKIATILSTIDIAIEQTEALIEKYQHIKAGLMQDLFTRGVLPNGQLRPPRNEAPELYQDTAIGWIPMEWQVSELERVCRTIVDCPHSTPSFQPGGVLVARTMHIKNGVFLENEASRVTEKEFQERIARAEPTPGDVILTREAPVGEAFVIPPAMKICLGQRVMLIKPNTALLDSDYLVAQIYSGGLSTRITELTAGTTNPHLNVADVRSLLLTLPPFKEQQELTRRINAMNGKIHIQQEVAGKLKLQKLGLMQDLLTGKVAVTVAAQQEEHA
jgi:type I restriction enzyme, S subunit